MFIRFFADTTGSQLSIYALEYMRSFMRVAPVRLASVTGILAGRWQAYAALLTTPMVGPFINAVCCDPSRWTWMEKVPAGTRPVDVRELGDDREVTIPAVAETITGRVELYTAKVHNVLFAVAPPRSSGELATAIQYEAIVVPTDDHASAWRKHARTEPTILTVPITDHPAMRAIFLPGERDAQADHRDR